MGGAIAFRRPAAFTVHAFRAFFCQMTAASSNLERLRRVTSGYWFLMAGGVRSPNGCGGRDPERCANRVTRPALSRKESRRWREASTPALSMMASSRKYICTGWPSTHRGDGLNDQVDFGGIASRPGPVVRRTRFLLPDVAGTGRHSGGLVCRYRCISRSKRAPCRVGKGVDDSGRG